MGDGAADERWEGGPRNGNDDYIYVDDRRFGVQKKHVSMAVTFQVSTHICIHVHLYERRKHICIHVHLYEKHREITLHKLRELVYEPQIGLLTTQSLIIT